MSVIHAPRKPEFDLRQVALIGGVGLVLIGFLVRLWYVQVVDAATYSESAEKYRWSTVPKLAPRGLIFDRKNNLIAGVRSEIVITAVPKDIQKNDWVIDKVAGLLNADPKKLREKLEDGSMRPYLPTPIYIGAPVDVATRIAEARSSLPGIDVDTQPMRYYPNTWDMAHILGYVWTPDPNDQDRFKRHNWNLPDYVGKQGVEWSQEEVLMGKPGSETIEVDSHRRPVRVIGRENATPGDRLILTLDRDLQKYANQVLDEQSKTHPNKGCALVALDPSTGEILCLASQPSYDTKLFQGGISRSELAALQDDPMHPLFNRAVSGSYSPGSTFKLVTALAAYETGHFSTSRKVVCRGYYLVGKTKVKCLGTHGAVSFRDALAHSCNAYFSQLATDAQREGLVKAAQDYGIGERTGIELRGETRGSLPTDNWLKAVQHLKEGEKPKWYQGMTINIGIGQGEVNVTALQMANAVAMVANGGVNYKPHLVKATINAGKRVDTQPEVAHHPNVEASFWYELQQAMIGVIEYGTAKQTAQIPGVTWAGKTGSTEHGASRNVKTHSWFVGYAPANHPRIAIAVVFAEAGHGAKVAVPAATSVVKYYLKSLEAKAPPATTTSQSGQ